MAYLRALMEYLRTDKVRHDLLDYLRAIMIMLAVMTAVRIGLEIIRQW